MSVQPTALVSLLETVGLCLSPLCEIYCIFLKSILKSSSRNRPDRWFTSERGFFMPTPLDELRKSINIDYQLEMVSPYNWIHSEKSISIFRTAWFCRNWFRTSFCGFPEINAYFNIASWKTFWISKINWIIFDINIEIYSNIESCEILL